MQESFESRGTGTKFGDFVAGWSSTTGFFTAGDQAGLAASSSRYLDTPTRFGAGDLRRFAWFDASAALANPRATRVSWSRVVTGDCGGFVVDLI